MKLHVGLAVLILSAFPAWAQSAVQQTLTQKPVTQQQTPPARAQSAPPSDASSALTTQSRIDPEKEAAIRRLLEASGAKAAADQTITGMMENMKPLMVQSLPPGEYREKLIGLFLERFKAKFDVQQLADLAIPIYDKYFTTEEINSLRQYYLTPIGQKLMTVLPKITVEMQSEGMNLGQKLGRETMVEVLNEHPEMMKALEEAGKAAKPQ